MSTVRVVGVAILRSDGGRVRVLAAERREVVGQRGAGSWELPGGKCEPGEGIEEAAVREVREELGCEIGVLQRLDRGTLIRPGLTLEVVVAVVLSGEPRALEHPRLRWLAEEELDAVAWLPADRPFLADLRPHLRGAGPRRDGGVGRAT